MEAKLVVAKGKTAVKEIPLSSVTTIIGRKTDCGLRIPSPLVSRQHCELTRAGERLIAKDLGSSNGTFVNGTKIKQKELKSGDTLGVGPITFIVQLGGAAVSPSDTARPHRAAAAAAPADDAADFVVAEEVETAEAAEIVAEEEAPTTEAAEFVVTAEEAPAAEEADFVVNEEATSDEEADFVVAEPASPEGDTVHDMKFADIEGSDQSSDQPADAVVVEEEAESAPPPEKSKKKKGGLFGRLFGKKNKKEKAKPEAVEPPPAPKSKAAPPAPQMPAQGTPEPAASDQTDFVVEDDTDQATSSKPVGEDDLADFLMGLNEKEQ